MPIKTQLDYDGKTRSILPVLTWFFLYNYCSFLPGEIIKVCGVASQGRPGFTDQGGWFVKTYTIAYSKDGEKWTNYKEFGIAKVNG